MVLFGKANAPAVSEKPAKEHGSLRRISSRIFSEEKRPPTSSSTRDDGRVGRPISINPTPPLSSPKDSGFSSWQTTRASSIDSRASSRAASIFSIDTPGGLAQTLLRQGRKLKRHASKLSLNSLNGEERDSCSVRDMASPSCSVRSSMDLGRATPIISGPTNFQHITHAKAQQFSDINSAQDNDLILEFSVLRASQVSRTDLRDIRADDLHSRSSSVDLSVVPSLASASSRDSLVGSGFSTPGSRLSVRSTRSKDSFSQPYPKLRRNRLGPPPVAPPRISSKWAFTRGHRRNTSSESSLGEGRTSEDSSSAYTSDQELQRSPSMTAPGEEAFDYGQNCHAVSTEGDYAYEHDTWYYSNYDNILPCVQEEEAFAEPDENSPVYYNDHFLKPPPAQPEGRSSRASGQSDSTLRPGDTAQRDSGIEVSPTHTPKKSTHRSKPSKSHKNTKSSSGASLFSSWRGSDDDSESDIDPFIKTCSPGSRQSSDRDRASKQKTSTNTARRKPWRSPGSSTETASKGYTPKLNKQLPKTPALKPSKPSTDRAPSSRPQTPKSIDEPRSRPQTPKSIDESKSRPQTPKSINGSTETTDVMLPEVTETPEPPREVNGVSASVEGTTLKLTPGFFSKVATSATHQMVQVNLKQLHDTLAQLESQLSPGRDSEESPKKPSRIPVSSALKTALRRPTTPSRRKNVAFASDTVSPVARSSKVPATTALPERAC